MKMIGIGHRTGVGKDTFAKYVIGYARQAKKGTDVQNVKLAKKIKDIAHDLYGWAGLKDGEYYEDHRDERRIIIPQIGLSALDVWVKIGVELEKINPRIWVDYLLHHAQCAFCLVTDMRRPEEAHAIREQGGVLVKVVNSRIPPYDNNLDHRLDTWTDWDYVVNNEGTVADLYKMATQFAEEVILR